MSDIIFTTKRLSIRNLRSDDFAEYFKIVSSNKVMNYIKPALNYEEAEAELSKFIGYYTNSDLFYNIWAVTINNKLVGICGVYQNQQSENEIAYRLTESVWGKGYGKEIARALIDHSLSKLKLNKLVAYVYTQNIHSVKILDLYMILVEESIHKATGMMSRKYAISKN